MPVGGLRALLLQALHPVAAHGFAAHSRYRDDPWPRLLRTADFVALTTFGTTAEVARAAGRVRAGHARASFVDPDDGSTRRIDEPELLLWVHCCLVDSMLGVTRAGGLRLSAAEADRYVAEQVRAAALLGLDPAVVPDDRAGLDKYFRDVRPRLRLCAPAGEAVSVVLAPPMPAALELVTPARAGWSTLVALAFSTLPVWARAMFPGSSARAAGPLRRTAVSASLRAVRRSGMALSALAPSVVTSPHEQAARHRLLIA